MINSGKKTKNFDIENFKLSLTIQAPQNKFIAKKWHQNIIKKPFSENNSDNCFYNIYNWDFHDNNLL